MALAGVTIQAFSPVSTSASIINSMAAVLLWASLLHFLRPHRSTGPLVAMLFQIVKDMRTFLLLLLIVLAGFANAFFLILATGNHQGAEEDPEGGGSFSTGVRSLRDAYAQMLGDFDLEEMDSGPTPVYLSLLWVTFMMVVAVILLNVLIAIISDSFDRVVEDKIPAWRHEKAKVVLSSYHQLTKGRKDQLSRYVEEFPWIQVLLPTQEFTGSCEAARWNGRVAATVTQLEGKVQSEFKEARRAAEIFEGRMDASMRQLEQQLKESQLQTLKLLEELRGSKAAINVT
ncbi:unnamed protein product [Chrysoparadoxa australica]